MNNMNVSNTNNTPNQGEETQPIIQSVAPTTVQPTVQSAADQTPTVTNGTPVSSVQPNPTPVQPVNTMPANPVPNGISNGYVPPTNNGGNRGPVPPQGPGSMLGMGSNGMPNSQPVAPKKDDRPWNYLAIGGFVSSFVFAPVGLALSIPALIQTCKEKMKGKGLAIAGTVIGGLGSLAMSVSMFAGFNAVVEGGNHGMFDRDGFSYGYLDMDDYYDDDMMPGMRGNGGGYGYGGHEFGYGDRPESLDRSDSNTDSNNDSNSSDSDAKSDSNAGNSNKSDSNKSDADSGSTSGSSWLLTM